MEIDNSLSDPHIVLGTIALLYDWDWDKAKDELTTGNYVNLKSLETFNCAAHVLQVTGGAADAEESLRKALQDDPLSISLKYRNLHAIHITSVVLIHQSFNTESP